MGMMLRHWFKVVLFTIVTIIWSVGYLYPDRHRRHVGHALQPSFGDFAPGLYERFTFCDSLLLSILCASGLDFG